MKIETELHKIADYQNPELTKIENYKAKSDLIKEKLYKDITLNKGVICLHSDKWHKPMLYKKGQYYEIIKLDNLRDNHIRITLLGEGQKHVIFEIGSPLSARFCLYDLFIIAIRKNKLEKLNKVK